MTKLASSTLVDHKALIRADFANKGLNFKKFRGQVLEDMSESSSDDENPPVNQNVSSNSPIFSQNHISDTFGMQ